VFASDSASSLMFVHLSLCCQLFMTKSDSSLKYLEEALEPNLDSFDCSTDVFLSLISRLLFSRSVLFKLFAIILFYGRSLGFEVKKTSIFSILFSLLVGV